MRTYTTEGIVLKRINFSEADRIVTVYTRHFGKIKVLARGIRKITSRKGGNLELFNWAKIFVVKGRNLDIVTEAETVRSFRTWRKDLVRVAFAYHFCELVDKLTPENVQCQEIFDLLAGALWGLGRAKDENLKFANERFAVSLLEATGFWPRGKKVERTNLDEYLESITEKKIACKRIFKDLLAK